MDNTRTLLALVVVTLILVVLYMAYTRCKLDRYLPSRLQKCPGNSTSFVGAMAEYPSLVPCAFNTSDTWMMNRCNYA